MTRLHELGPAEGSKKDNRRRGRGHGSGLGKTAGRGHKGQRARSGGGVRPGFEGGQMPLQRRLPYGRGFKNPFRREFTVVNLESLNRFRKGARVTPERLLQSGVINSIGDGIKVLARGELTKALTVQAHSFSKAAIEKIEAAGGKVEVI